MTAHSTSGNVLGSAARGKGHLIAAPTPLPPEILMGVDILIAQPYVSIFILDVFQGSGRQVAAKVGVILYS